MYSSKPFCDTSVSSFPDSPDGIGSVVLGNNRLGGDQGASLAVEVDVRDAIGIRNQKNQKSDRPPPERLRVPASTVHDPLADVAFCLAPRESNPWPRIRNVRCPSRESMILMLRSRDLEI
jgi:hypothetical protein